MTFPFADMLVVKCFQILSWKCQRVWLNTLPLPKPNAVAGATSNTRATLPSWPLNAPLSTSKCQSGPYFARLMRQSSIAA